MSATRKTSSGDAEEVEMDGDSDGERLGKRPSDGEIQKVRLLPGPADSRVLAPLAVGGLMETGVARERCLEGVGWMEGVCGSRRRLLSAVSLKSGVL